MSVADWIIEFDGQQYGMLAEGFRKMPFEVCKAYLRQKSIDDLGNTEKVLDNHLTYKGKELITEAESMSKSQALFEYLVSQQDPDLADEFGLDQLGRLIGMLWLMNQPSVVNQLKLTGTQGTEIPDGSQVSTIKDVFLVHGPVTIQSNGEVITSGESLERKPVEALAGEINQILDTVPGWSGVENLTDAIPGRLKETKSEYRVRRKATVDAGGSGNKEAIRLAVKNSDDAVISCKVFENDTNQTDERGQPKRSLEVFVQGGDEVKIAQAMWDKKAGATPYVSLSPTPVNVVITDSEGEQHTMTFTRPDILTLYVTAEFDVNEEYPQDGDLQAQTGIKTRGDTYDIGDDVVPFYLGGGFSTVPGIVSNPVIKIGTSPDPTSTDTLVVSTIQWPQFDSTRIIINSNPV